MKIGDELLCIEDIFLGKRIHTRGCRYKIIGLKSDDRIVVFDDEKTRHTMGISYHTKYFKILNREEKLKRILK